MGNVITFANHKGGVGKTTSTASIGAALANRGYKVLLVDLDTQFNLTNSFIDTSKEQERTIYNAMKERKDLPVVPVRENLSIVPSSLDMASLEMELFAVMSRETILEELLTPVRDQFDFILVDCPPALGVVVVNAFVSSDFIFVPLTAEALPFKGLTMLETAVRAVRDRINPSAEITGIFITRWEHRKLNQMVENSLRETYGDKVLTTKVRSNISLAEVPLTKTDIFQYSKSSNGAKDYEELTGEILDIIEKHE